MQYTAPKYKPEPSKAAKPIIITAFFAGIIALIPEISLFKVTFISSPLALLLWAGPALLIFPFCLRTIRIELSPVKAFLSSIFFALGTAGLPLYIFFAINYYCADAKTTRLAFTVLSADNGRSGTGKCITPTIEIQYKKLNKVLTYPCGTWVDRHKVITLAISKGFLGFEVIKDQAI